MILVDPRIGSGRGKTDLAPYLERLKVQVEKCPLIYGDCCFDGKGPDGIICVGVERKTLSDILNCIDDARYSASQKVGMSKMYGVSILIIEGIWKPDPVTGYLMECIRTMTWAPFRYRSQMTRYSKLFRYLLSVQLSGVMVIQTRDIEHTAYNIYECYQYFQKKWSDHTSLLETQKLAIPDLRDRPSLVRRWAADITGVGVKLSMDAEQLFRTPIRLAQADEMDWMRIPKLGVITARKIVKEIRGWR